MPHQALQSLPEGYKEIYSVNLQNNKKIALLINIGALIIAFVMAVPAAFIVPISSLFDMSQGIFAYMLRFIVLIVGCILYIILHELTHAAVMKYYGAKKVNFGFTGLYAYAGSNEDYFRKKPYLIIALSPLIVFFIIFGILCFIVPQEWFWVIYFLQMSNVCGASGDMFVFYKFSKMPKDILIKDTGVGMTVYSSAQ